MMSSILRNNDLDVITFKPEDRPDLIRKLKEISFDDLDQGHFKKEDYISINWFDFECISVLIQDNKIYGFSSVWHRPEFYEKGEVRILNRYWEHDCLRRPGRDIARPHLIKIIQQQLKIVKKLGFKKAFISRCRNRLYMKNLFLEIEKKTNTKWHFSNDKVAVCRKDNPSCWQYKGTYEFEEKTRSTSI